MINWTIGSGGTYSNWAAALSALPATLDDDYTLTQISATDEGSGFSSWVTIDRAGYDLILTSDTPHNGDPTQGWAITAPSIVSGRAIFRLWFSGTGGDFEMSGLKLDTSTSSGGAWHVAIWEEATGGSCRIHDCMLNGCATSTTNQLGFLLRTLDTAPIYAWNLTAKNCVGGTGSFGIRVENSSATSTLYLENSTFHNCMQGISVASTYGGTLEVRNCCAFGNSSVDYIFLATTVANGYNNASEDGTATLWTVGSGNITGIIPSNEFESTTWTSSDYVKLKQTGTLGISGTTTLIAGNIAGIRGDARPGGDAQYSIGADEVIPVVPPPQPSADTPGFASANIGEGKGALAELGDSLNLIADNLAAIKAASQLATFGDFKSAIANIEMFVVSTTKRAKI